MTKPLDAIVIGAGFAGLYQLHLLRDRLGLEVEVIEAGDDVGGTWYWNRYPGARCDSESHNYCYTFSEALFRDWDWSERYPGHAEIRRYLSYVADRLDLRKNIRFGERVTRARYDDATNLWSVTTADGIHRQARYLITAVGCLSTANVPDIPGRDSFAGRAIHTGNWPHEPVDFSGKRVGIIGTGSTGIQVIPVVAETAAHLTVFQRTANYSVPARNAPLTPDFRAWVRDNHATLRAQMHGTPNGHSYSLSPTSAFDVDHAAREAAYEQAWETGGLQFRGAFSDIILDRRANETASTFIKEKIRNIVHDPVTAGVLADIDHGYSTKRPPIDTNYFETYNRANVSLVDLRAEPIRAITPDGVAIGATVVPLDILIFATGFDAMTGPLFKLNITGRDEVSLAETWREGPTTYLGLQVPGFPNMFTITGPGSPSVLTNMPVAIEQHAEWITDCIAHARARDAARVEATAAAAADWNTHVEERGRASLLYDTAHSWYLGANIPGKPRRFMPYAGGMARYRALAADVAANGYRGFRIG